MILRSIQSITSADQMAFAYKREPLIGLCILLLTNLFIFLKQVKSSD